MDKKKSYQERLLKALILDDIWGRQMRFIAGPRQCGKTTLAKKILSDKKCQSLYFNWDIKEIRARYREDSNFFYKELYDLKVKKPWLCFDEIHKVNKWKDILKGFFDANEDKLQAIITGSARLDLFRKSGDSLKGRYMIFHLLPLSLAEMNNSKPPKDFIENPIEFLESRFAVTINKKDSKNNLEDLIKFSGFPEPLIKSESRFHKVWQRKYKELSVYEDLSELSQIHDLDKVAHLIEILPSRVGTPLSLNSLREDLEINHRTVSNYLKYLRLAYMIFYVRPYTESISRSIKKEAKVYFFDWTRVNDLGAKFENYIACELYNLIHYWNDSGTTDAELFYVRQKDKKETDFLITINKKPWLLVETKINTASIAGHHYRHADELGGIPILQINYEADEIKKINNKAFIVPASRFLG